LTLPARPPLGPEPAPPLRAVMDIPLRLGDVSPATNSKVSTLSARVGQTAPDGDWPAVYADAVSIVEQLVGELDAKVEEVQKELLGLDDPNEVRQRVTQGPRRDAEKARSDAKTALQRVTKEWTDRAKRQLDHVQEQCTSSAAKSMMVTEEPAKAGVKLGVDRTWWAQFSGFAARCCDEWTRNATTGAEQALAKAVSESTASIVERTKGRPVKPPATQADPRNEAQLKDELPEKEADVPSFAAALGGYVRSNIMAVGMFGTMIAVVIALAGRFFGSDDGASARPNTMLVRGGLLLAVLPIVLFLGIRAARKQRDVQRDKALTQHRQAVRAYVDKELRAALEKHRGALERWIAARGEAWAGALDAWWDEAVEPALARTTEAANEALKDLRVQQTKLQEKQSSLRTLKSQIGGNLLFDLKRRQREYQQLAEKASQ
jgi:hypothetical protein